MFGRNLARCYRCSDRLSVAIKAAALRELARVARRDVVVSVPREPIWRIANMGRGKYLRELGNTPGHINHWSKGAFVSVVADELAVRQVRAPFPWTMVAAEVRPVDAS